MPRLFVRYLDGTNIYSCTECKSHLSCLSQLISKAFHGRYGSAYLFNEVINVKYDSPKQKHLSTGVHEICQMYCSVCHNKSTIIGWKYIRAVQDSQKYKEGKFILEKACISKTNWIDQ